MADGKEDETVEEADNNEVDPEEAESTSDGAEGSDGSSGEENGPGEQEADDGSGGGASDTVEEMAESEELEGLSKEAIADALSDAAGDLEEEDLAEAVASLAESDEDGEEVGDDAEGEETSGEEEDTDEEESPDETSQEAEAADGEEDSAESDARGDGGESEGEDEQDDETDRAAEEARPTRKPAPGLVESVIGGIFTPDRTDEEPDSAYIDDDLEGEGTSSTGILAAGGVSIVLLTAGLVFLFGFSKQGERLVHLFKGDLKEYELADSKRRQAELREKQRQVIEDTPKIGTLKMRGKPQYALIKVDGEIQYGKPEGSDYWKRMRLTPKTNFPVFYVEDKHEISIESPGHMTRNVTLEEGNWTPVGDSVPDLDDAALKYQNQIRVTLVPESRARELEFHKRMEKNPENDFYGEVTIESKPEGAKIIFDGAPLKNEEGEELTTPVTFEKYYVEPEEEDDEEGEESEEAGDGESEGLEEKKVKVDMPPDKGHKIQLELPDSKGDYPKFVSGLQREMWTCEWKDGEEPDNPSPEACNYKFSLSVDFEELKSSIEKRKSTRQEIKDAWAKAQQQLDSIVEEANRKAGVKRKKKKKKGGKQTKESGAVDEKSE